MVSGSDQHGTPITIKAEKEGVTPADIASGCHQQFLESWQKLGISFDLFTTTGTPNHASVAQDIFLTLKKNGYIYKDIVTQPFCPKCQRFLPDRYIEGTCPFCHATGARGDQCDSCGKPLNPSELLEPRCQICDTTPEFKESEHFFLKLSAFQERLEEWAEKQSSWRPNVINLTRRYLKEGLRDRAITRDIDWGVPVPEPGFEHKCLYVWFEAVTGYLSASKEWAAKSCNQEAWQAFWQEDAKSFYFIGKDNIPFHTLIWPAMIMGYGNGLRLPYDVPANEFLTIEGKKLSTSRNWAVWVPDYLERYDPDPLRYILSINMPENGDTDFSWREFVRRNNDELVATYGNLVNRVLTFTYRNFEGCIPSSAVMDDAGAALEKKAQEAETQIDSLLEHCDFKQAIQIIMSMARDANRYLDEKAPWKAIKENRETAANSLFSVICVIARLKNMLYPFLPFTSQKVHEFLGFEGELAEYHKNHPMEPLPVPGQRLREPKPLFTKLDEKIVDEETRRIGT